MSSARTDVTLVRLAHRWFLDPPSKNAILTVAKFAMSQSQTCSMREFGRLSTDLHERLSFSPAKKSHNTCLVFGRTTFHQGDRQVVVVHFDVNAECDESDAESETVMECDELLRDSSTENVPIYLILLSARSLPEVGAGKHSHWRNFLTSAWTVSIPNSVEETCYACFSNYLLLHHVTFGVSSRLRRIPSETPTGSGLRVIHVPDNVVISAFTSAIPFLVLRLESHRL